MSLGIEGSTRTGGIGATNEIAAINARIKGLRKQLLALQKQLREATDPEEQKWLMKQIMDLQRMIQMEEQRIVAIQQEQQRRRQLRNDQANDTKAA